MSLETLLLAVLALQAVGLAVLLLRRPPPDPAAELALTALERQGERLAVLAEQMRDLPTLTEARLTPSVTSFAAQQTRALARLQARLADRLEADARTTREAAAAEARHSRDVLDRKLREVAEAGDQRLAAIERAVHEQLTEAVERRMTESFTRVIDQFNAIQAMMGQVQSVAAQVGDLRRVFANVKTRGGWGEAQLRAILDDFLPPGAYETNVRLRPDRLDSVEFAILMPGPEPRPLLPLDAKFPVEDYERLLTAHEAGDAAGEAAARRGLEARMRAEAAKIAEKYLCPPRSTEFAILYLPSEGLYAEAARLPGLLDQLARDARVFVAGPALLPAMLRTVQLGYVSFALSENASGVRDLLAATKEEMRKMEGLLAALSRQVAAMQGTIGRAQARTRAIARKLRSVDMLPGGEAARLLEIEIAEAEEDEP
jgi:DNA recombination protein RmuC